MAGRKLSETRSALELVLSGKTIEEAAALTGIHRSTVYRIVRESHPDLLRPRKKGQQK